MKKYLLASLLISFFLVGTWVISASQSERSIREDIPPQVLQVDPFPGDELQLDQPITFYFDQPMDRGYVEKALSSGGTDVTLNWLNDTTVRIAPVVEWTRASEISLNLDQAARSQEGVPMAEDYTVKYWAVGYLQVVEVLPARDQLQVAADSTITVIFNRPVVPLTSISEQASLPQPITIEPAVAGEGEWLNTSIYIFTPEEPLESGTQYTAEIAAGLTDTMGAVLPEDFVWHFSTLPPQVTAVTPLRGQQHFLREDPISVSFSQPMDTATTSAAFFLMDSANNPIEGEFTWNEEQTTFTFQPDELLDMQSEYLIFLDATVATAKNGTYLDRGIQSNFFTVPYPLIRSTEPDEGQSGIQPYSGIFIYFNTYMDEESLEGKVSISPEIADEPTTYYSDSRMSYILYYDLEPDETYTVTVEPGMTDLYGNVVEEGVNFTFTTASLMPEIGLNRPGFIGLYNGGNPTTRIFATHRNVSQLDLQLFNVEPETLMRYPFNNEIFMPDEQIRSWSVDVGSERNVRRYELLILSDADLEGVENLKCLGAPPVHVEIGQTGRLAYEDAEIPLPLNMRDAPSLMGEEVSEVLAGDRFEIVDGPICNDSYFWWQIELNETRGWVVEGTAEQYFIEDAAAAGDPPAMQETEALVEPLEPGIYYLAMTAPETSALSYDPVTHVAIVATHNITLKASRDQLFAWVTDLETGLPAANQTIMFYNRRDTSLNINSPSFEPEYIGRMITNEEGVATLDLVMSEPKLVQTTFVAVLDEDEHFGYTSIGWQSGLVGYDFDFNFQPEDLSIYLQTDRAIYRPDQVVYFKGIVRDRDDVTYTVPEYLTEIPVEIVSASGDTIYEATLPVNEYGSFSGEFRLGSETALGNYELNVDFRPEDQRDGYYYGRQNAGYFTNLYFMVAEYVVPEYFVSLSAMESEILNGDELNVLVEADYFFGAGVNAADVEWNILAQPYYFAYTGEGYYSFNDYDRDIDDDYARSPLIANGTGTTNDQGDFLLTETAELGEDPVSQVYTVEGIIRDESGRSVVGRTSLVVHAAEVYLGSRPAKYIGFAGEEMPVDVISVDWNSQPVAEQIVEYEVVERNWYSVQEEDEMGRTVWTWEVEETPVSDGRLVTSDDGTANFSFIPPNAGTFKIKLSGRDAEGRRVMSSSYVWVSGRNYVAWRMRNSDYLELVKDQDEYHIGDTAQIMISSPFQGETYALITVERAGIQTSEVIKMESNSYVYNLPIALNHVPNVFVSVVVMKGVDETSPYPQFKMGTISLPVNREQMIMNVEIIPPVIENDFAEPGEEVTYTLRTTDYGGKPVQAEVGLSLTDKAVLGLVAPNTDPLLSYFYAPQVLSVHNSVSLIMSVDRVTQQILDVIKGGGGGGGGDGGYFEIRENFVDTPGWEPSLVTDENGEGQFTVTLPDNLTTWNLDARAVTFDADRPMLVGQATSELISSLPLIVRPQTPRFFIISDETTLGAVVNNNTGEDLETEISMEGTGFTLRDGEALTQTVTIPAKGRVRVDWHVTILNTAGLDLTFYADAGTYRDASKPPLGLGEDQLIPVYRYEVPETVATSDMLTGEGTQTEAILLPPDLEVIDGELTVKVDRSLASATLDALTYLKTYPYYCTEQTVSRFLPNIITLRALQSLGIDDPELSRELDANVNIAVQKLLITQKYDGGWGWFPADASNPLVTAYALIGLTEANLQGYIVPDHVIADAIEFLQEEVNRFSNEPIRWEINRQAFLIYAMTYAGSAQTSPASVLFDTHRVNMSLDAEAFLAMAMAMQNPDDPRLGAFMTDFASKAVLSATGAHWEEMSYDYYNWSSERRTTALVLKAMIQITPDNALIPQGVRWLMSERVTNAWASTQETAWALMSLTDWMVVTGELQPHYSFRIGMNGAEIASDNASPENIREQEELTIQVKDLLQSEANRLTFVRTSGEGNLYYTAHLSMSVPVPAIEPASRGIILNRAYYEPLPPDADPETPRTPITEGQAGDWVEVVVTIIAPENLHYVVVEDPLPAGAEAVDPHLQIYDVGVPPNFNRQHPLSQGWGWWWFSSYEMRDEKVVLYANYLPRGTYEFRYTMMLGTPGTYNVIPTSGFEFYFPEVYGRGAGSAFVIKPEGE